MKLFNQPLLVNQNNTGITAAYLVVFRLMNRLRQQQQPTRFRDQLDAVDEIRIPQQWEKSSRIKDKCRFDEANDYLDIPQLLSYSPQFQLPSEILKLVSAGEIPYHEMDGQYVFKKSEIDGWMELNTIGIQLVLTQKKNLNEKGRKC